MSVAVHLPPSTYVAAYAIRVDSGDRLLLCRIAAGYDATTDGASWFTRDEARSRPLVELAGAALERRDSDPA